MACYKCPRCNAFTSKLWDTWQLGQSCMKCINKESVRKESCPSEPESEHHATYLMAKTFLDAKLSLGVRSIWTTDIPNLGKAKVRGMIAKALGWFPKRKWNSTSRSEMTLWEYKS